MFAFQLVEQCQHAEPMNMIAQCFAKDGGQIYAFAGEVPHLIERSPIDRYRDLRRFHRVFYPTVILP
jgi:hypothetical protein